MNRAGPAGTVPANLPHSSLCRVTGGGYDDPAMPYALLPAAAGGFAILLGWPVGGAAGLTAGILWTLRRHVPVPGLAVSPPSRGVERLLLGLAVLVAALTRLPGLGAVPPPGLHIDEHRSVWFAAEVLRGERIWPPADGAEPLSVWAFALAFLPAGPSLAAARLTMALAGAASVPLLWWAVRPATGPALAVLAALALAGLRWHILLSRIAQPYVLVPLAVILALGALLRAARAGSVRGWWWAGVAAAAGPYTYLAGRAIPPVMALAALLHARPRRRLLAGGAGLLIALLPLLIHYVREPAALSFRVEHLSRDVRDRPLAAGWRNLSDTLRAFTVRGDGALSSSWPGAATAPLLGPVTVALLVTGLPVLAAAPAGTLRTFLALLGLTGLATGALAGMSWPSYAARIAMLVPVIVIAQAAGLAAAAGSRTRPLLAAAGLLLAAAALDGAGFVLPAMRGATAADAARWTGWPDLRLARDLRDAAQGRPVFLTPDTNRESASYTKFRGACLLEGVRVVDPPAADWARIATAGGVGVMLWESREQRDLARECFPESRSLLVGEHDGHAPVGGLTLLTPEHPPRFPLGAFADIHAAIRAAGDLAAAKQLDAARARLDALERRWPRLGTPAAVRASLWLGAGRSGFAAAEREARRALARSGDRSAIALNVLGFVALGDRNWDAARERLRRSLELDPVQSDIRETLLRLSRMSGGW